MSSTFSGIDAGTATRMRDRLLALDGLVARYVDRMTLHGRSLRRLLDDRASKAQLSYRRSRPVSSRLSLGYSGRMDSCDWSSDSPCPDPAPYEVRARRGTRQMCIRHLSEYRMIVHGFGPALRQDRTITRKEHPYP